MTHLEEQLKNLHLVRLSDEARSRMRGELLAYAELHAVVTGAAHVSARAFRFRIYASLAAVLLIVVSVGGTAFAAENALPGDALYSVKVGVTEPIQTALIPSEQGKAAWHAILAERRLEEASELAAANKLSPQVQAQLATNFDTHVQDSVLGAEHLQASGDADGSLSVRSDLEARLTAHAHILDVLAAHYALATSTEASSTTVALHDLLSVVQGKERTVSASRLALEDSLAPAASPAQTKASTATSTAPLALSAPVRIRQRFLTQGLQITNDDSARTQEVQAILSRHAAMLAKFLPAGTSTLASSTASSTATTTPVTASTTVQETIKPVSQ